MTRDQWLDRIGRVPEPSADLHPAFGDIQQENGFRIRRVTYLSDDDTVVPAYLLLPDNPLPGNPALLCCHGYGNFHSGKAKVTGRAAEFNSSWNSQANEAAQHGFVVLAPDMFGFEERGPSAESIQASPEYFEAFNYIVHESLRYILNGSSYQARCIADLRAGADVLQTLADVNPERIGMFGHSFGGWETLFMLFYDARIKAGVCSCGVTLLADIASQKRRFGLQALIPGLLTCGDMDDIFDHIAPKPLLLLFGEKDKLTRPAPTQTIIRRADAAYRAAGQPDSFASWVHSGGHEFNIEHRTKAFEWLKRHLSTE
ncbi:MAG: alpha/beta fold hydrolase [Planctomycetota bacterium]